MQWPWSLAFELASVQAIAFVVAFSSHRLVFHLGAIIFGLVLLVVLVEPFARMLSSWRLEQGFFRLINYRVALCEALATFSAVLPYRWRGYRWAFRRR